MCLAVPMRLIEKNGADGTAELSGVRRGVRLDLVPDAPVGCHLLVHAGYAIQVVDEEEARATLRDLEILMGGPVDGDTVDETMSGP